VGQLTVTYQLVHGGGTHAELGGDVAHREQDAGPAGQYAEPPRTLQLGCSKNLAKRGYRRRRLETESCAFMVDGAFGSRLRGAAGYAGSDVCQTV
jgi:hypothetical protein